ncbi:MAG: hypothetical protein PHV42_01375 [Candidatus Pacebacteria bacterium]|nr:hypothetical protein [Candidatus Paceibacterota bacterium]
MKGTCLACHDQLLDFAAERLRVQGLCGVQILDLGVSGHGETVQGFQWYHATIKASDHGFPMEGKSSLCLSPGLAVREAVSNLK